MRVHERHKQYAAEKLQEGMTKREIVEKLQAGVISGKDDLDMSLTQAQANNVVRNQAKKLGVYNALSRKEKEEAQSISKEVQAAAKVIQQNLCKNYHEPKKRRGKKHKVWGDEGNFEKIPKKNPKGKKPHVHA